MDVRIFLLRPALLLPRLPALPAPKRRCFWRAMMGGASTGQGGGRSGPEAGEAGADLAQQLMDVQAVCADIKRDTEKIKVRGGS